MSKQIRDIEIIKSYESNIARIEWRSDGILHYNLKDNCFLTLEDTLELYSIVEKWGATNKYLHLFEFGINSSVDTEVRKWASSSKNNQHTIADAMIVRNMAHRIVGNFYTQFNKPVKPTKLFSNKNDAIQWLYKQQEIYNSI